MRWEHLFARAVDGEHDVKVHLYGTEGMYSVTLDNLAEADLTEEEAKLWLEEQLAK